MKKSAASLLLLSLLAACASTPTKTAQKPAPVQNMSQNQSTTNAAPAASTQATALNPFTDPNNPLSHMSVYFGTNKSNIQSKYMPILAAHAKYIASHPSAHVRLEGNCDERGSTEYNLALGERRAVAVKQVLEADGAPASQLQTISYGKEKPKALGHNEAAWAQNRRTDLDYLSK
ncbi:MAG: peptidoglycan-associated lipoprotein Pal [Proteobacteria bacterium]|nr:peptidoglycan-associated lipoprotein Pal [Pseudomonadota bacterium]MDE3207581.1 peptidoglycan-associated lipoprotein Pal [Pseudomonadota bacterium]